MNNSKPFVAAAFACERILEEPPNVISAIRIVDTFTTTTMKIGNDPKVEQTAENTLSAANVLDMSVLVILKAGAVTGHHELSLTMQNPQGKETKLQTLPVDLNLNDPAEGIQVKLRFMMPGQQADGLYWMNVLWDGEALTSIPIRLNTKLVEDRSAQPAPTS